MKAQLLKLFPPYYKHIAIQFILVAALVVTFYGITKLGLRHDLIVFIGGNTFCLIMLVTVSTLKRFLRDRRTNKKETREITKPNENENH